MASQKGAMTPEGSGRCVGERANTVPLVPRDMTTEPSLRRGQQVTAGHRVLACVL